MILNPRLAFQVSDYTAAPVLREVDIHYHDHAFNGSFIKENIYRLEGSPEVDAAWEALGVDC